MEVFREVLGHALLITGFVFVMMLVIEYLNVLTQGRWDETIARWRWGQSVFASFLGATPGCLGAFAASSLYAHQVITGGALVAAMLATCGDEAFIMLALFPGKALVLIAGLFAGGVVTGVLVDLVLKSKRTRPNVHLKEYQAAHAEAEECIHFSRAGLWHQWRHCSPHRGWLALILILFIAGLVSGAIGHHHLGVEPHAAEAVHALDAAHGEAESRWNWVHITMLVLGLIGLGIVVTVPEHFLDEHLWHHLVRKHLWRLFLWTLGALAVTHVVIHFVDLEGAVEAHKLPLLLLACLIGLIPLSGPHLVFVMLYAQGQVPVSILLASCIVQDGHGMIPVLAHSRRAFLLIKAGKFAVGLALGFAVHLAGW